MRIISGSMKGLKLYTLDGVSTRPTLDRVKESLFNIIQNRIKDSIVLDLFSGSGALAIESISRGAKKAVLCDKSYNAIKIIMQNVSKTRCDDKVEIINKDYIKSLKLLEKEKFDIVFIDPPYDSNIAVDAVNKIINSNMLSDNGIIILETDNEERELSALKEVSVNVYDLRKYGRIKLIFLNRKG